MEISKEDLIAQRELIQDNIICILDSWEGKKTINDICQAIVDGFQILLDKYDEV